LTPGNRNSFRKAAENQLLNLQQKAVIWPAIEQTPIIIGSPQAFMYFLVHRINTKLQWQETN